MLCVTQLSGESRGEERKIAQQEVEEWGTNYANTPRRGIFREEVRLPRTLICEAFAVYLLEETKGN